MAVCEKNSFRRIGGRFFFLWVAAALLFGAARPATAANQPPVASDMTIYGLPGATVSINLSASDSDDDELTFTVSETDLPPAEAGVLDTSSWKFYPNKSFDYAANDGVLETSFLFSVSDTGGLTDTATCFIVLRPGGNAPTANDVTLYVGQYPSSVEFILVGSDAETASSDLTIICPSPSGLQPQYGSLVRTGGRINRYRYSVSDTIVNVSRTDYFNYNAFDGIHLSATATVTVVITQPPQPEPLSVSVVAFGSVPLIVTTFDPDGDELTYEFRNGPRRGSISGTAPVFTYTPDPGFAGYDDFEYVASDPFYSIAAPVRVRVIPAGEPGRTDPLRCSISPRQRVYFNGVAVLAFWLIFALRTRSR